jgi:hypothetical protein
VFFTDVEVPKEHLLGELQPGVGAVAGLARARAGDAVDRLRPTRWSARSAPSSTWPTAPRPVGGRCATTRSTATSSARFYVDQQALMLMGTAGFSKHMKGKARPSTRC